MSKDLMSVVKDIPVDQKAVATHSMKMFLLGKLQAIRANRKTIAGAALQEKRDKTLESYKKSIGFDDKLRRIRELREDLAGAERVLYLTGINENGAIMMVQDGANQATQVHTGSKWVQIDKRAAQKIRKLHELVYAVEKEIEPFDVYDQLEARMMMASTVGECMAIVNAVAGSEVFSVSKEVLQLE